MGLGWAALWLFVQAPLATASAADGSTPPRIERFDDGAVIASAQDRRARLVAGQRVGRWTLMAVVGGDAPYAVLEDFSRMDGELVIVDTDGVRLSLPKSSEATAPDQGGTYLGHALDQVMASPHDLLAAAVLDGHRDPDYARIARALPPITKVHGGSYGFLGTPDTFDKVPFAYGGRSPNFDPAIYQPSVDAVRKRGQVRDGLVGGDLPVIRFVYPEADGAWTEMLAYAPFRKFEGNDRIQPVWYRVSRIEHGELKWVRYVDTYVDFPMRTDDDPRDPPAFYRELEWFQRDWSAILGAGMQVELPDKRMQHMARFGLVRSIMTRIGDFPKYGVVDRNYGGAEHDGFPDTFNVETTAMLDWGLVDRAGRYLDNYLGHFVRDDGALVYRGPETGQYGRVLTVAAQYAQQGGDPKRLLRHRTRLDAIARLLLDLRAKALALPERDPAHGMLAAWSEADSVLEPDPERYMQPYFSNSTEAARGFRELGEVWERLGRSTGDAALAAWGQRLQREAAALNSDVQASIARSLLEVDGETIVPAIAGVREPFHVAVARDRSDPQYRSYRAYMEMLHSGLLDDDSIGRIVDYRARHHDSILGIPTAYGYNTGELVGFLSYGHGYGLLQADRVREHLLLLYALMAHQYTRGSWLAPETRSIKPDVDAAPYCTPAQLAATLLVRWLLVFEDPRERVLWLGKGTPREWLRAGETIRVANANTRWGRIGYRIHSQLDQRRIEATVELPVAGLEVPTHLRLRAPTDARMRAVSIDGQPWQAFDPAEETVTLPAGTGGTRRIVVHY